MAEVTAKPCNKRQPVGPMRCELPAGHKGAHAAFNGIPVPIEWANRRDERAASLRSNRRPQRETYEHELAEAMTDGIKADRIVTQILLHGHAFCVKCRRDLNSRSLLVPVDLSSGTIEALVAALLEEAMHNSAKHHGDRRRGHGYRPKKYGNDFGHDAPWLIDAPLCHDCHTGDDSEVHPGLKFSEKGAA